MSFLRVDTVKTVDDVSQVSFPAGLTADSVQVTGIVTATTANFTNVAINNNLNISGIVTANSFSGDGSALTNLVFNQGDSAFNLGINTSILVDVGTISPGIAFTVAPAGTGGISTTTRFVIESIQLTNISTGDVDVTSEIYSTNQKLINELPMPTRTSLELLVQPKVLLPGDYISMRATASGAIKAVITGSRIIDADGSFFGGGFSLPLANTYYDIHDVDYQSMFTSLLLVNKNSEYDTRCTVVIRDGSNNIIGYYASQILVPANSSVEIFEKNKFLSDQFKLSAQSTVADSIDVIKTGRRVYPSF
jgi:hypothetical protein